MVHKTYACIIDIRYGVATISRMLKNIGLFCKRALQKRPVFCKETCVFKHPTHRSHPISEIMYCRYEIYCAAVHQHICLEKKCVEKKEKKKTYSASEGPHASTKMLRLVVSIFCVAVWCRVLQCVAVCCSVVHCGAVWCSVVQCGAVCCSVLQCVAVCCSVLQCNAMYYSQQV